MNTLEHAIVIATQAHAGQIDKAGAPYILHPLRVMLRLSERDEQIVAVLHDVVEDSDWTLDQLRAEGFSEGILAAIDAVTRRDEESYEEFILRAAANPISRRVKLADLEDNSDLRRIANPTQKDTDRLARYQRAMEAIQTIMNSR